MPAVCDLDITIAKSDYSALGLGDARFEILIDHGIYVEVCNTDTGPRGEDWRDPLDAASIACLGRHGDGPDHG